MILAGLAWALASPVVGPTRAAVEVPAGGLAIYDLGGELITRLPVSHVVACQWFGETLLLRTFDAAFLWHDGWQAWAGIESDTGPLWGDGTTLFRAEGQAVSAWDGTRWVASDQPVPTGAVPHDGVFVVPAPDGGDRAVGVATVNGGLLHLQRPGEERGHDVPLPTEALVLTGPPGSVRLPGQPASWADPRTGAIVARVPWYEANPARCRITKRWPAVDLGVEAPEVACELSDGSWIMGTGTFTGRWRDGAWLWRTGVRGRLLVGEKAGDASLMLVEDHGLVTALEADTGVIRWVTWQRGLSLASW